MQRFMMMLIARFIRSEKDSDEVYGAPRITAELDERYQISVNRKTVAKRMVASSSVV
ncbi:IS3 family transposase [Corynebacterium macginleyi]|uniref:IS3 family transposase n=1 Tax=Corynebacterium macginleyi TaxID=38290 RepID=UPI00190C3A8F|nr:IS3 family transposase [Corynebacterium macginleyi]MBK4148736.1 IS3 family transposase [Corynebacterium macginleyi]